MKLDFQELSKEVKFKYEFYMVEGGGYGSFKNGRWTGMIADLRAQKADMAVIDMSITSIRQTAVDFTMPYMTTGEVSHISQNIVSKLLVINFAFLSKELEFYTRRSFHLLLIPSPSSSPFP